jgi:hypothetical protein
MLAAGGEPGVTDVVRTTGTPIEDSDEPGILRHFAITPTVNSGLDATVVFHYDESDLNGLEESELVLYVDDCSGWSEVASTLDQEANTVTGSALDSLCEVALSTFGVVSNLVQGLDVTTEGTAVNVSWRLMNPVPVERLAIYRVVGESRTPYLVDDAVVTLRGRTYSFTDTGGDPGSQCAYRVAVLNEGNPQVLFETGGVTVPMAVFDLEQNSPNPFNPVTEIAYSLPETGHVVLDIYDAAGRHVHRLVDAVQPAGSHRVKWHGVDRSGAAVGSGAYFYQLTTEGSVATKKMLLLK